MENPVLIEGSPKELRNKNTSKSENRSSGRSGMLEATGNNAGDVLRLGLCLILHAAVLRPRW